MDVVRKNRRALKGQITRVENSVAPFDVNNLMPKAEMTIQERNCATLKTKCAQLLEDCSGAAATDVEFTAEEPVFEALENRIDKVSVKIEDMKRAYAAATGPGTAELRLPKLEPPTFSGDIQEWISFQDLFVSSIHNNTKLSGAQKLQYLKVAVKGEAALLIQAFQVTDLNYAEAWKTLQERYEDKREIIRSNFERFLSQPNLPGDNPAVLQRLVDTTRECVKSFELLKVPMEKVCELLIIHLTSKKLDSESRLQWERTLKRGELPTFKLFCEFLDHHARVTAAAKSSVPPKNPQKAAAHGKQNEQKQGAAVHHESSKSQNSGCSYCGENHHIFKCKSFQSLSVKERWSAVYAKRLCLKCLSTGHRMNLCKWKKCKHCDEAHNLLLHEEKKQPATQQPQKESPPPQKDETATVNFSSTKSQTLLSTALVRVTDSQGNLHVCRALLDMGSEATFIHAKCATKLGLRTKRIDVPLTGFAESDAGVATKITKFTFMSCYGNQPVFEVNALVVKKVTKDLPSYPVVQGPWPHLDGLQLADPRYWEPSKIDILIGRDVYHELTLERKISGRKGTPVATETHLGWILGGSLISENNRNPIVSHHIHCDLEATLKRFWELEEVPRKRILTLEEKMCEEHFAATHKQNDAGRFVVNLPFKTNPKPLGESKTIAVKRLKQVERRLARDPVLKKKYADVLQEYLDLGHMEKVPAGEVDTKGQVYYMPHHGVVKESSTTTKLRVVFDASAKSSSGVSLNENLLLGPRLQDELVQILIRFRQHRIAFTADIEKMYRQVLLQPEECDYQRIVWRNSPEFPITDYRLVTATFGSSAAPYLAVKCVQQLALKNKQQFPEAANVIVRDFYVDDLMSGADTETEGLKLQADLIKLLHLGGFELRKWSSNFPTLLESLPVDMRETNLPLSIDMDEGVKTLGLQWHPAADYFCFKVTIPESPVQLTKRTVLSEIAKVFDPLGWLSPVTITAKLLMQKLWIEDVSWDDPLPPSVYERWMNYREQLPQIGTVKIPRYIALPNATHQIHGFCDASEDAYAAVVFLRSVDLSENITVQMIAAKSKVAPLKRVTLPRLELCGAVLLVRLIQCISDSLTLNIENTHCWTDSTIVLAWLASPPQRWKTFVANRVSEIQDVFPHEHWSHVKSESNPADCASRGIPALGFESHQLWWNGPSWLSQPEFEISKPEIEKCDLPEKENSVKVHTTLVKDSLLYKYSDLNKLLQVTAYWQDLIKRRRDKAVRISRLRKLPHRKTAIPFATCDKLEKALMSWVTTVQECEFHPEIHAIKKGKDLPHNSKLKCLVPFLDEHGVLRVGGRLKKSELHGDAKHQILLPKKHHLTQLIIDNQHKLDLHAGPQLLLTSLQQKYWIPSGRDVVRQFVRKCIKCFRFRAQVAQQQMGDLPKFRVTPSPPFEKCGVDYAGPFLLTPRKGRGQKQFKSYIAVFVCFVTHAIHLELVSDLTTDAFIAALHRFISRRGKPTDIHSDCGTNFVGAKGQLEEHHQKVTSTLATDSIAWHLNPAASPHHGGIWEAGVKSMKFHLKRVIGTAILSTEEMVTLLAQVEACLNSRPITELSSDANDLQPLTPGHFIIDRALTALPERDLTHLKENHLSRWQRVQQLYQHFWKRWSTEHLTRLQQRNKWNKPCENLKVGDIVLVTEENLSPNEWRLGRILETFPGTDGRVRVVKVKTATTVLERPITKLCVLPLPKDEDEQPSKA